MTNKNASLSDNNGICEGCGDPATKGRPQTSVPVYLAGGLGWGKLWLCDACRALRETKERKEGGKL
jgi:predicted ATPase